MCDINKVDMPQGRMVRHRFSCPGCSHRCTLNRRITSMGKKLKTFCYNCQKFHKVYIPDSISPTPALPYRASGQVGFLP